MKKNNDQIDFNFSRPLDIQKDISSKDIYGFITKLIDIKDLNIHMVKHLKLLILELFYCWNESENQFLVLSMSKRGYHSKSRYNPNNISSYVIKAVNFLKEKSFIEFYPGFYDRKTKNSRLSRIRASKILADFFEKQKLSLNHRINHPLREYLIVKDLKNRKQEYKDNFSTHEKRELINSYNQIINKTLVDIPTLHKSYLTRADKRKVVISDTNSISNLIFLENISSPPFFEGCWWDRLDFLLMSSYQDKILINNQLSGYIDLNDFLNIFLKKILQIGYDIPIKKINDNFDFSQRCNLILRAINLKNQNSFEKSLLADKRSLFYSSNVKLSHIRSMIENFMLKNNLIFKFFFKGYKINWKVTTAEIFKNLLITMVPANIPVVLINEKIYFPLNFQTNVENRIVEVFEKKFNFKKIVVKTYFCDQYHFKNRSFFSKIIKPKNVFSQRYLKRVDNFKLK